MKQSLNAQVTNFTKKLGACLVGVAPVERFRDAPEGHMPEDLMPAARSVIVFANEYIFPSNIDLDKTMIKSNIIGKEDIPEFQSLLIHDGGPYAQNILLNMITYQLCAFLSNKGYKTLFIPPTYTYGITTTKMERFNYFAPFSHRHAAVLAGLGEIGLNNLLITPQYGTRVRLGSVITEATLNPSPLPERRLCPGFTCSICVRSCKRHALTLPAKSFVIMGKTVEIARFEPKKCDEPWECSGYCQRMCPIGKK